MRTPLLILVSLLAGCVSTDSHNQVVAERDQLAAKVSELEGQVTKLGMERDRLARVAAKKTMPASVDRKAEAKKVREAIGLSADQPLAATFHTTAGDIRCELYVDSAPKTVLNFVELSEGTREWKDPKTREMVKRPLYNGTIFHRVIPDFMIQGGDPLGSGRGGPGYKFEDEIDPAHTFNKVGQLAMANSGRNTNGSQFFITDAKPHWLNGKHTIFGQCENLDVVKAIISAPANKSKPVNPVSIESVEIHRG